MDANGEVTASSQHNGRIMLSSVITLFAACAVLILFHMYSKRCTTARPAVPEPQQYTAAADAVMAWKPLDPAVVAALSAFVYESENRESPLECAVCLSEFEGGEKGRLLPECKHSFHVDCIDMWFRSHSDCPLCRGRVKEEVIRVDPVQQAEDPNEVIISIMVPEDTNQGSGSGSEVQCSSALRMSEVVPRSSEGEDVSGSDIESGQRPGIGLVKVLKVVA